jgi:hypothetical protein
MGRAIRRFGKCPEAIERQQRQACQARWSVIGRESSPTSIRALSAKQALRVRALILAQGEKGEAGGLNGHLLRGLEEGRTSARETPCNEVFAQGSENRILTAHNVGSNGTVMNRQKSVHLGVPGVGRRVTRGTMGFRITPSFADYQLVLVWD